MPKVKDHYSEGEFAELLEEAENNAESGWDAEFTEDMRERFDEYGEDMFLSDAQRGQLERIANGDED